ncbi:Arf-GAP with Rho-GAP domain, ANK repeat and PH domain-containing protein 3, partial [Apaloderma vittatum]
RDVFKQHGYHVARDATSLDGHHLQQIGITATGHRKRILNLVQQTRMLKKDSTPPLVKPVPKPRTVFPRSKPEQGLAPVRPARTAVPAQSPGKDSAPTAFVVLEGFVPGESSTDLESPKPKPAPPAGPRASVAMGMGASWLRARERAREQTQPPPALDHGQALEASKKSSTSIPSVPPRHSPRVPAAESSPGSLLEGHPTSNPPLNVPATPARRDPSLSAASVTPLLFSSSPGWPGEDLPPVPQRPTGKSGESPQPTSAQQEPPNVPREGGPVSGLSAPTARPSSGRYPPSRSRRENKVGRNPAGGSFQEPYPKGVIPLSVIEMARSTKDNKFQVFTSHRIFVFRAENEAQRNEWCSTLQKKVMDQRLVGSRPRPTNTAHCQKSGTLELKGQKSKVFAALTLPEMWLYKSEQFFKMGIGICLIEMRGSTIREAKNRSFELITPFKIFRYHKRAGGTRWGEQLGASCPKPLSFDCPGAHSFVAESEREKHCWAQNPDWASINLCVVICKQCAGQYIFLGGQHRSLGSNISKVQSLKLDTSVWSNEIVQLFIMLGNDRANRFWAARLPVAEALYPNASAEQRRDFISRKYREGRYRLPHPHYVTQEDVLQALCTAVTGPALLKTILQFFSSSEAWLAADSSACEVAPGADLWWGPESKRPRNHSGPEGVYNEITQPVTHSGYLYRATHTPKLPCAKKSKEDFQRTWCSLEKGLLFFETEKCTEPLGHIESGDLISLGVSRAQAFASPGPTERFRFTLELFLTGEKVQQLGTDGPETLQAWASAIGKWFTPVSCHCLLGYEFQRVGQLRYKCMLNPERWQQAFFILQKAHLFICPAEDDGAEDSINLRRLQELSLVPPMETPEKKEMLVLVEMGRTFYLQGLSRADSAAWYTDIQASAGGRGLRHEGIYRKNGAKSRIKVLMEEFRRDARNVKLRISDNFIEDVTDVLKRFFRELEDPVFTLELHSQWKEAAAISSKPQRLERYKELIHRLPRLNHKTLAALIGHLYRVQKCADLNQMTTKNLSLLFAPSLFQTDGKGEHEVKVMEDLIDNYVSIFNIDEDQVSQMDLENSLITTWKDTQLSQAGDLIIEVCLEQKLPDCCVTLKVSPTMTAEELTNQVLEMRNVAASLDIWLTFEALENGELERPLHPKEKVLEQALEWCKLPEPSSAYLLVRKVPIGEGSCLFTGMKRETPKCGLLKCREEPPKLLGNKFQERYFVIQDRRLLLLKEKRSVKPEREWPLDAAKVYMGIRKKLKPPAQWGFTLTLDKQQLYLVCSGQAELWDWTTSILKAQHDDLRPVVMRRHSSSDLAKQKFGTMPLVPLHGDSTDATMLSANQTLRRLHTRRTLSMFF